MKPFKKTPIIVGLLSLITVLAFAKQEKVLQIFRNGEIIQEYPVADLDYIEVNDLIQAPTEVIATVADNQITIRWNAVEGATYNIYRSPDKENFTLLDSDIKTTTYTDMDPLPDSNYYRVTSVVNGKESKESNTVTAINSMNDLPSGIYLGIYGFSRGFQTQPICNLSGESEGDFHSFINNLTATQAFTWLYYTFDKSIDYLQTVALPKDLSEVAIVTFTDGLDIGSLDELDKEEPGKYLSSAQYREALNARLVSEKVADVNISAYTIGVLEGKQGSSLTTFRNNMRSLASSTKNVFEVEKMENLNQVFEQIANSLSETKYVQQFKLSISGHDEGELCRFTFDNISSYQASKLYIEGTYRRKDKALTNIKYVGLTSSSGSEIIGEYDNELGKYNYLFKDLKADDGTLIPTTYVQHWYTDAGFWQDVDDEFYFNPDDATLEKVKRSAAIMLNLDCSKSMAGQKLATLKDAANKFVETLANNTADPFEVSSVELDKTEMTLPVGATAILNAVVLPTTAKLKTVTWSSSSPSVADVDNNGNVTAKSPGHTTITVTTKDGGFTATCEVTVIVLSTDISLNESVLSIYTNETAALKATVFPDNTSNPKVEWSSSDPFIAEVDSDGNITPHAPGHTKITVTTTDGSNLSAACDLTVLQHVESVEMNTGSLELKTGETFCLTATVLPGNATNKELEWESSDSNIAAVDQTGYVTAKSRGSSTITAKAVDGGFTTTCVVTVSQPVTEVTLDKTWLEIYNGDTETLTATVLPDNANNKEVIWRSSEPSVATVDENGLITGLNPGKTIITAIAADGHGATSICKLTVIQPVSSISLDKSSYTLVIGSSVSLIATVYPFNASNKQVIWSSSNEDVASVNSNGVVQAKASGSTTISATSEDGNFSAECTITVESFETFTVNGVSFKMIRVNGGDFMMGSDDGNNNEKPVHNETIYDFSIGETEVTQALWEAVMGKNPSYFKGDELPVEQVSWNVCQEFINRLNDLTGKQFRLPTEAEWEYAARGGELSEGYTYSGSNDINEVAWYKENSGSKTHPVAQKQPNELGIYDMSGNVVEWTSDWYSNNYSSSRNSTQRVLRGGSWFYAATICRVAYRYGDLPGNAIHYHGLRLAL